MDQVDLYVASSADGMGRCGWGGVLVFGVHQKVLSGVEQTNGTSRTQLLAVLRALLLLKRPVEVTVHTNCQDLARWLEHGYERKDQALSERVNEVRTLTRERGLRLKARLTEGNAGLEAAKRAARSAVDEAPALSVTAHPGGHLFTSEPARSVDAWTDGACSGNPGAGGWGCGAPARGVPERTLWRRARHDQQPYGTHRCSKSSRGAQAAHTPQPSYRQRACHRPTVSGLEKKKCGPQKPVRTNRSPCGQQSCRPLFLEGTGPRRGRPERTGG